MPSSPAPPYSDFSRPAARLVVLLGPSDGSPPSIDNEVDYLIVEGISKSHSGGRLDAIMLKYDLVKADARLIDTTVPIGYNRQVEIRRLDADGEPTEVLAWGFLDAQGQAIGSGETVTAEAILSESAFGQPITALRVWDQSASEVVDVHWPLVFNPTIDDLVEGNRSDKTDDERGDCHLFVDPESLRTDAAKTWQEQQASEWMVSEAVHWLCWNANPDEEHIDNPTLDDLQQVFAGDSSRLKNFAVPYGLSLPAALDALLQPFGWSWYVEHKLEGSDRKSSLRFFRLGEGPLVNLYLQRPGETISLRKTNVDNLRVQYDLGRLRNHIVGRGGLIRREVTVPLIPAWPSADDATFAEDLHRLEIGQADAETHRNVGRKFALNEAGDYIGLRTGITAPFDLAAKAGVDTLVRRRRRFQPCLSRANADEDPESAGYLVEWWDEEAEDATSYLVDDDPGWTKSRWRYSVLEKECGIYFEGATPPGELWLLLQEDKLHLRITAAIDTDLALEREAVRRSASPSGRDQTLFLDLSRKFFDRQLADSSVLSGDDGRGEPDERDDATQLTEFLEQLRDENDAATVSVSVQLDGVDHSEYQIGQLIESVVGRNLTFNANNPDNGNPRRMQIVGFNWRFAGGQKTELMLEDFRLERGALIQQWGL